jgi:flagellar biosynthesis chaperone FliJ
MHCNCVCLRKKNLKKNLNQLMANERRSRNEHALRERGSVIEILITYDQFISNLDLFGPSYVM